MFTCINRHVCVNKGSTNLLGAYLLTRIVVKFFVFNDHLPHCSLLKRNQLRWFGRVERKDKEGWVRECMYMEVEDARPRGRPRRTWLEMVINEGIEPSIWTVMLERGRL